MGMHGADTGQLSSLAGRFARGAESLESLGRALSSQLDSSPWKGPDAERFRAEWRGSYITSLNRAATILRDASASLQENAGQQDEASRAGSASAVSAMAATTLLPPSGRHPLGPWTESDLTFPLDAGDWPGGRDPKDVTTWWNSLSEEERNAWRAQHPELVGNTNGIPFDDRIRANRANLANAIAAEKDRLNRMTAEGASDKELREVRANIADWEALAKRYADTSEPGNAAAMTGRKLIAFDPDHSVHVELVGCLDEQTTAIGILVPGTGTNIHSMDGTVEKAESFVNQSGGRLAMVAWLGGDMPQGADAAENKYARDLGPKLTSFTQGFDNPRHLPVTVAGHSYGGSIVGDAEKSGMVVNRIMHIESAGAGPDVRSVSDYAKPDTPRYNLEAPGDPIRLIQGAQVGPLGHGADPSNLEGVYEMETGWADATDHSKGALGGPSAHTGVFTKGSTAWWNMYNVFTGQGQVELESGSKPGFDFNPFDGGFGPRIDNGFEADDYVPNEVPVE